MLSLFVKPFLFTLEKYSAPLIFVILAWANINSGFWNLHGIESQLQTLNAFRAFMPYVLPLFGIYFWYKAKCLHHRLNPVAWLVAYGALALLASVFSKGFEGSFYFGMAFIMNVLIPAAFFIPRQRLLGRPEVVLLTSSWLILAAYVIAIYIFMKDQLAIGYGIAGAIDSVTRSSGLARFFGVAGLLCFARVWQGQGKFRWVFLPPLVFCSWVVWNMQSRGGMFGFIAGVLLLFFLSRIPWRAIFLSCVVLIVLLASGQERFLIEKIKTQVARGQESEQFQSMTGRTHYWKLGWEEVVTHPVIGQGQWADRTSGVGHVHNSYLQALMNAGFLGFVPYMMSWITGWWLFYKLFRWRKRMQPIDQQLFMETAAVMTFFTVRSIPETTTASFSVDSMLMVPVYIYLFVLYQRMRGAWRGP